jgi:hypothetical protein
LRILAEAVFFEFLLLSTLTVSSSGIVAEAIVVV